LLPIFLLPFFSILAALIRFLNPDQVSQSAQVVLRLELRSTFCLPRIGLDFRWTLHFASHVLDWIFDWVLRAGRSSKLRRVYHHLYNLLTLDAGPGPQWLLHWYRISHLLPLVLNLHIVSTLSTIFLFMLLMYFFSLEQSLEICLLHSNLINTLIILQVYTAECFSSIK
jgi:hypothetical protein